MEAATEKVKLNPGLDNYLRQIYLLKSQKKCVRARDVALRLQVTRASVSRAVHILEDKGLLHISDTRSELLLTGSGEQLAKKLCEKYAFFYRMLRNAGVSESCADEEAAAMACAVSDASFARLRGTHSLYE